MKQCKCGSMAFNLAQEGFDQGDLCDRHYWQDRAEKAEASVALLRTGDTCARQREGTAYRIEARSMQSRIETLIAAFRIEREGLVAERDAAQEDAARYRWSISSDENAEILYSCVMSGVNPGAEIDAAIAEVTP